MLSRCKKTAKSWLLEARKWLNKQLWPHMLEAPFQAFVTLYLLLKDPDIKCHPGLMFFFAWRQYRPLGYPEHPRCMHHRTGDHWTPLRMLAPTLGPGKAYQAWHWSFVEPPKYTSPYCSSAEGLSHSVIFNSLWPYGLYKEPRETMVDRRLFLCFINEMWTVQGWKRAVLFFLCLQNLNTWNASLFLKV